VRAAENFEKENLPGKKERRASNLPWLGKDNLDQDNRWLEKSILMQTEAEPDFLP
jgi:hypothetical protein